MFIVEREKKNIKKKACFLTSLLPIDHGCFILFSGVFYLVVFHCSCCSYWKKDGLIRLDRVEGMHSVSRGADTWGHFHLIRLSWAYQPVIICLVQLSVLLSSPLIFFLTFSSGLLYWVVKEGDNAPDTTYGYDLDSKGTIQLQQMISEQCQEIKTPIRLYWRFPAITTLPPQAQGRKVAITYFFPDCVFFFKVPNGSWSCTWNQCEDPAMIGIILISLSLAYLSTELFMWTGNWSHTKKHLRPGFSLLHHLWK